MISYVKNSSAALLIVAVSALLAACGSSAPKAGVKGPSEVAAAPVSTTGANPFMPNVGRDSPGVKPPAAAANPSGGVATYVGSLPGLYGGTRNYSTCSAEKLVTFLEQHRAKAVAWASTLGIQPSQIRDYVSGLTSVILRTDTRVTNHGFQYGIADPIQSVLQAGTAVFVDKYGAPVVKCYCGNPLTPPVTYAAPTYTGPLWTDFSPSHITIINQSTTIIKIFTLYDPATGQTYTHPAGPDSSHDGPYTNGASPSSSSSTSSSSTTTLAPPTGSQSTSTSTSAPPSSSSSAESPAAAFSPNPGRQGDTFTLSASGFNPNSQLDVSLTRPDGVVEHYSISTGAQGTGVYTFSNTQNVLTGTYTATVSNPATGGQAQASLQVSSASGQ